MLSNNITALGERTFQSCEKLPSLVIPKSVTSIGKEVVDLNCKKLTNLYYTGTEAEWKKIEIDPDNQLLSYFIPVYNYVPEN